MQVPLPSELEAALRRLFAGPAGPAGPAARESPNLGGAFFKGHQNHS